ncbi:CopG family transcriptional regulator [Paraburkholderia phosphatilytica]|uniref:CopG family transcriptional regulator n=1 Tax=Paraburkholderia phosphatilytica TaxID=2282883 RepID=UPI000E533763|nr:CopG family transcriptional regulator [Paraburkholderia phosphatilytica]
MRTTLVIDDDVLSAVRERALREHRSLGEVLSALARQSLRPVAPAVTTRNGLPLLTRQPGTAAVTPELVNQLRDDLP